MFLVELLQGIEHSWSGFTMLVRQIKEIYNFAYGCVLNDNHLFWQHLQ